MKYKCKHCGFEGYCYGMPTSKGVSAPFYSWCGKNDGLKPVKEENVKDKKD